MSIVYPYSADIVIKCSKIVNSSIAPLSEQQDPVLVDYEVKANQLVWLGEIHSVPGVTQKIIVCEGAYISVEALSRVGGESFSSSGFFEIVFAGSAWAQVSNGDSRIVKGYYTFYWEKWYYPTSGEYVEHAYCHHCEGTITKCKPISGDGKLPPYNEGWHWKELHGGEGFSHTIMTSVLVGTGTRVHFDKIDLTLGFCVKVEYWTGFKREVSFNGTSDTTYYIYDKGRGSSSDPDTWPAIYVARKP